MNFFFPIVFIIVLLLSGCGGGGSSPQSTEGQSSANTSQLSWIVPETVFAGERIALAVLNQTKTTHITQVTWQQTFGPAILLLQNKQKLVSLEVPQAGDYSFIATVHFRDGSTQTGNISFTAESGNLLQAQVILDRSAYSGEKISLKATANTNLEIESVNWRNESIQSLIDLKVDQNEIFFTAPTVFEDQLITLTAEMHLSSGEIVTDQVTLLVQPAPAYEASWSFFPEHQLAHTFPMNADSPQAEQLRACVYSNQLRSANSCTFNTLPLIATDSTLPSIDKIMDHVLVSHEWMGNRFRAFLEKYDDSLDFRRMLGNVTAIVIASDIERSAYRYFTGAIYIKPDYFALTPAERRTLTLSPESASISPSGPTRPVTSFWRYTRQNTAIVTVPNRRSERTVTFDEIEMSLARALYHELAHATDYISPARKNRISTHLSPFELLEAEGIDKLASNELRVNHPLLYSELNHLAENYFLSANHTVVQDTAVLTNLFEEDYATDLYAHLNAQEDLAMLFEEAMMQIRFSAKRDIAFADQNQPEIVFWGQRGRIGANHILPRVADTLGLLRPDLDAEIITSNLLEAPAEIRSGSHWLDTANYPESATPDSSTPADLDIPQ